MKTGQSLSQLTSRLLLGFESYFSQEKTDFVLGHGDTTTCFAAALSAFYHRIPFFHVEAGLRSRCLGSPFPEEFNRQSVAPLASHHFAPTDLEKENLLNDGIKSDSITVTGATVHEAVQMMLPRNDKGVPRSIESLVSVTLHRRENRDSLCKIISGLRDAAVERPETTFILPLHPNPMARQILSDGLAGLENVVLSDPLPYPQFISLLMRSRVVLTDSGGIQEEASFLGVPVLLARGRTERADGLQSGLARLVGVDPDRIRRAIVDELDQPLRPRSIPSVSGMAASQIIAMHLLRVAQ